VTCAFMSCPRVVFRTHDRPLYRLRYLRAAASAGLMTLHEHVLRNSASHVRPGLRLPHFRTYQRPAGEDKRGHSLANPLYHRVFCIVKPKFGRRKRLVSGKQKTSGEGTGNEGHGAVLCDPGLTMHGDRYGANSTPMRWALELPLGMQPCRRPKR